MVRAGVFPRRWIAQVAALALGDFGILIAVLTASIAARNPAQLNTGLIGSFLPVFALFIGAFYSLGLYELRQIRDFVSLIGGTLVSAVVCGTIGAFYFYMFSSYVAQSPKTYLFLVVLISHLGMLCWRRAILLVSDFSLMHLRLLVLASDEHALHLQSSANLPPGEGLRLAGVLGPDVDLIVADSAWIEEHWDRAKTVFAAAIEQGTPIVSLDRFYESMFGKVSPHYASDPSWALEHVLPRADDLYFKARRVFDLSASLLGLIALSPMLFAAALLIRLVDRMPPFYGQRRVGYLGREFTLWKFRTMLPNSDAGGPFRPASEAEQFVTPLGRFLRRFRLDEFPQLWNVVRGDMALVGPRPEWVKEVEVVEKIVPNYHLRHLVPPGITGWAQIYYRATNDPRESIEKHHYDLYYLKNFSLALDISILLKTAKRVLNKDAGVQSILTPFPARPLRGASFPVDMASIISRN